MKYIDSIIWDRDVLRIVEGKCICGRDLPSLLQVLDGCTSCPCGRVFIYSIGDFDEV